MVGGGKAADSRGEFSAPRLASATARRHGISNQLLFAWHKAYREGRLGIIPGFVPAMMPLPRCRRLGFFWSLALSQAYPGPTAVLIDKLNAGLREHLLDHCQ